MIGCPASDAGAAGAVIALQRGERAVGSPPHAPHDHEPVAREQNLAAAQLGHKLLGREETLVDLPDRAVFEDSFLQLLGTSVGAAGRVADHQLGRHARRLGQELHPLVLVEVAVEVRREDALERPVSERQREGVAGDEGRLGTALAGELEHLLALVEPDDLARQLPGQKAGSTGDIERVRERERAKSALEHGQLPLPAGALALAEESLSQVPVVVLRRPGVVVLPHDT